MRFLYSRKAFFRSPLEVLDAVVVFAQICVIIVLTLTKVNIVICDGCLFLSLLRLVRLPRLCFGLTNRESGKYRQTIAYFQREESFHQHTVNNLQHRLDLSEMEISQLRQAFQASQAGDSFSVDESTYGGRHCTSLPVLGFDLSFADASHRRLPPLNETFTLSKSHFPLCALRDDTSQIRRNGCQNDLRELNGAQNLAYDGELEAEAEEREMHRRLEQCGNWVQKCSPDEQESAF
ncbi:hypothetical protein SprV_0100116100 [Sparganum proliferum]